MLFAVCWTITNIIYDFKPSLLAVRCRCCPHPFTELTNTVLLFLLDVMHHFISRMALKKPFISTSMHSIRSFRFFILIRGYYAILFMYTIKDYKSIIIVMCPFVSLSVSKLKTFRPKFLNLIKNYNFLKIS